ncbi:GMP/IMP nucleotidase [Serratia odorifera]|uniref:GMP/IMP nucleotidase n=1 Tax=Serratia odorifera TaxID=618 RepID=A0A447KNE0_SEROD|nr:GMP/IMP nucleotidase [Serratia odorifera]
MIPDIDWRNIDTVLLDMDGTLLDLEFDSHFWLTLVPQALSVQRAIPLERARQLIEAEYLAVQHTMNWYCFDYWERTTGAGYLCHDQRGRLSRAPAR